MAYKSVTKKIRPTKDTFIMGPTRTIRQKNGVTTTITKAVRDDGFVKKDITIFANGRRTKLIQEAIREGNVASLIGKYSQTNTFVALGVAA